MRKEKTAMMKIVDWWDEMRWEVKKTTTTTTYRHRSRQYSCTQQKHGPHPTIRLQTGDIQRREDLCVQLRSTGLGCMIKIPTVWQQNAVEIRTSTAQHSRAEQSRADINRIRSAAHSQQRLSHCYFTHLTQPIRLHQRGSPTLLSLWLDHGSDTEVRCTNPIGDVLKNRRGFSRGRMRSMTSTLCYLADPFSFVTAREANKRFNILSQRHKSHFCTHRLLLSDYHHKLYPYPVLWIKKS